MDVAALFAEPMTAEQVDVLLRQGGSEEPGAMIRRGRALAALSRGHQVVNAEAAALAGDAWRLLSAAWDRLGRPPVLLDALSAEMIATPALSRRGLALLAEAGTADIDRVWQRVAAFKAEGRPDDAVAFLDRLIRAGAPAPQTYCRHRQAPAVNQAVEAMGGEATHEVLSTLRRKAAADGVGPVLIASLPKSGTVYICDNLCDATGLMRIALSVDAFPADRLVPAALDMFAEGGAFASEHLDAAPASLDALAAAGVRKVLVHVRDPRQATVSWRHHLGRNLTGRQYYVRHTETPPIPPDFDARTPGGQNRFVAETFFAAAVGWVEGWWRAARDDSRFDIAFSGFSRLHADPVGAVADAAGFFGLERRFDAAKVTPPQPGSRHFRSGRRNEWREVFSHRLQGRMWERLCAEPGMAEHFGWQR